MLFMLDTDICSYIMKRRNPALLLKLEDRVVAGDALCMSVITYAELRLGAERSDAAARYHGLIDAIVERFDYVADWTPATADQFARIQSELMRSGRPIGVNDTMIAANALALDATLVTNNDKHFSAVDGLRHENWS
jgi:tRNA(fMet)-specific endonuclease VapC